MDSHTPPDTLVADRANSLYWSSDHSVNDIAEELDLSKGSLYGLIRPEGAGLACPECATELEYPNRTAREKKYVTCPSCGLEEEEVIVRTIIGEPATTPSSTDSRRTLWGMVLLGAAAGVIVARWLRR